MGALHNKWKKMKGYKDPEPPNCQSSMGEFFKKQEEFTPETDPYGGY